MVRLENNRIKRLINVMYYFIIIINESKST